ncbi:hypothetical protein TRIATDRAFT_318735 [Trichoderma atroviride IMI 206040]|uniref:tRNA (guanine(37)-N1)-methyltransferase n=1 Tax=Hypocrea atroviridis (strain ATCC 20476 / IMI 206040) TaxID=452589 RepID=G9NW48_HYPAI|nr:uncharacterized protein TRIATDRAFT_318735 [Trichoderma atroviride IMI 206040]EHK45210.1 hypothetical protein TRIATDRAFT_318735 [Trichoderma atroviride IMI 206040]
MEESDKEYLMNLFRAPAAARAAKTLDRSLFSRTLPTAAASLKDNKLISKYRKQLEKTKEIFALDRFDVCAADPDAALAARGKKCLVLKPHIKPDVPETWSPILQEASKLGELKIVPYEVHIGYDLWSYLDVMRSILPEDLHGEIPVGFNTAGHVAHLNIRGQYLPYKSIIAQVIMDKNPTIRTVINKVDNVGTESEYRTFSYEVLAGPDDMLVEVSEAGCLFKFDYSKVYWNTKLGTEHQRIVSLFKPGEVAVDLMAGIGPFAAPAGKKGVFVWANDKNPESYKYLTDIIKRNKVSEFVKPFNYDGHEFIRKSADLVLEASQRGDCALIPQKVSRSAPGPRPEPIRIPVPPTVSHYVMNLPASAIEFLHNFRGLYEGHEDLFAPHTETKLPIIHVHCFAVKADDSTPLDDICQRIEKEIGVLLTPGDDADKDDQVLIHEVRDVAPAKRMFCASFRLPSKVAFAPRS